MSSELGQRISVIVPVRDGAATLRRCLDGLAMQSLPAGEVVVIDNGSSDDTAAVAAHHLLRPRVIREDRPGSYAARNSGLAVATGDVLAFTDADCIPHADWLAAAAEELAGDADLTAGRVRPVLSRKPSLWEKFDAGHHVDQRKYVEVEGFGATANLVVRKAVFDAVGSFDARLRSGGDREFCVRATSAGYHLSYAPGAVVSHHSRRTMRETWKLHRRLGAGLHDLSVRGLQPPCWRDDQMVLPIGWAAEMANRIALQSDGRTYRQRQLLPLATLVVAARWTGRVTGR